MIVDIIWMCHNEKGYEKYAHESKHSLKSIRCGE